MPSSSPMKCPPLRVGQNACGRCLQPQKGKHQRSMGEARNPRLPFRLVTIYCVLSSALPRPARSPAQTQEHGGTDRELQEREPLMLRESGRNLWPFFSPSSLFSQISDPGNIIAGVAVATKVADSRKQKKQHSEGKETSYPFSGAMGPNPVTPSSSLSSCCCGTVMK